MAGVPPPGGTRLNRRKGSLLVTDRVSLSFKKYRDTRNSANYSKNCKLYINYIQIFSSGTLG